MFRVPLQCLLIILLVTVGHARAAVILQYHHVSDNTPASTSISPKLFETHLSYLEEQGFSVWPLPRLVSHLKDKQVIPDKVVVITFDDAYDSIYRVAYPMLKQRNWPFTVFVAPQPIEQKLSSFMTWPQLLEMQQSGATIANHSYAHAHFVRRHEQETESEWLTRISEDIEKAQRILTRNLGDLPKLLAYPYGEYTPKLAEHIDSLGFVAFGQQSGAVSSMHVLTELPRFPMTNYFGEMSQFKAKVASLPLAPKSVSPDLMMLDKQSQPESLRIELYPQALHEQQISCYFSGKGRVPAQISRNKEAIVINIAQLPSMQPGRSRLNCTAPSSDPAYNGRFHWFSTFWMRKKNDGNWYEEE